MLDRKLIHVRDMGLESLYEECKEDMEVRSQDTRSCCYAASEGRPQTNPV